MRRKDIFEGFESLPKDVKEYIGLVVKLIRYKRKVREDVARELAGHFEDAMRGCEDEKERLERARKLIEDFGDANVMAKLIRRGKKRCRPMWRKVLSFGFKTIGIVLGLIVLYVVYISIGTPQISVDYVAQYNRLNKLSDDESLNAAHDYQKAMDAFVELEKVEVDGKTERQPYHYYLRERDIAKISAENMRILRENLAQNQKALGHLLEGAKKPYCWWEREGDTLISVLMPELGPMRRLLLVLLMDSRLQSFDGDLESAINGCIAAVRLGNHVGNGENKLLLEWLVGLAIRTTAHKEVLTLVQDYDLSLEQITYLKDGLVKESCNKMYHPPYNTESMFLSDYIQRIYTKGGLGGGHMSPKGLAVSKNILRGSNEENDGNWYFVIPGAMVAPGRDNLLEEFENFYDHNDKVSKEMPWDRKNKDVGPEFKKWSKVKQMRYWIITGSASDFDRINMTVYRARIQSEAVIVVIALHEYKLEHGEFPESLGELVRAGLIEELPRDPFGPGDLSYRRDGEDFVLYSYGLDYQDGGGMIGGDESGNPNVWAEEGDAVFWPVQD